MWDKITYLFANFNGFTLAVGELISNIIPHFMINTINHIHAGIKVTSCELKRSQISSSNLVNIFFQCEESPAVDFTQRILICDKIPHLFSCWDFLHRRVRFSILFKSCRVYSQLSWCTTEYHDEVSTWKRLPHYWPLVIFYGNDSLTKHQ